LAVDAQQDLANAITNYGTALLAYQGDQAAVINATIALETAKANPELAEQQAAILIKQEEEIVKQKEAYIEALKNTEYSTMNLTELTAAQTVKQNEVNDAINKFNDSEEIKNLLKVSQAFEDARNEYEESLTAITGVNLLANNSSAGINLVNPDPTAPVAAADDQLYPKVSGIYFGYKTYRWDESIATPAIKSSLIPGADTSGYDDGTLSAPYETWNYSITDADKTLIERAFADDVQAAKDTYDADVDLLGTEADKADTTTKLPVNLNALTKYAELAGAKATFDAEKDSLTKVTAKFTAENDKLVQGYKDLAAAYALANTETTKADKIKAAQTVIGDELVKIFGDFAVAKTIADGVDEYVFDATNTGYTFALLEANGTDYASIKQYIEDNATVSTVGAGNGNRNDDQILSEFIAQETLANGAEVALIGAQDNVANQIDAVAASKEALDEAETAKDLYETSVAKLDIAAINEAAVTLSEVMFAWDAAMIAVDEAYQTIVDVKAELDALNAYTSTTVNIDEEIAQAETDIANAKTAIENLKSANTSDLIISQLEEALAQAQADLNNSTADLFAAKAAIDAIIEQMGLDVDYPYGDETGPLDDEDAVGPVDGDDSADPVDGGEG
jgi:hypothetical protein